MLLLKNLLEKGLRNKKKIFKPKTIPKISFRTERWEIYTEDKNLQNSISAYLNSKGWDGVMDEVSYNGRHYTCFPIISLEMLNWIRRNYDFSLYKIFHKVKRYYSAYRKLKPDTEVKE